MPLGLQIQKDGSIAMDKNYEELIFSLNSSDIGRDCSTRLFGLGFSCSMLKPHRLRNFMSTYRYLESTEARNLEISYKDNKPEELIGGVLNAGVHCSY